MHASHAHLAHFFRSPSSRWLATLGALLLLAGCASSPNESGSTESTTWIGASVQDRDRNNMPIVNEASRRSRELLVAPAAAWSALVDVYRELEVPVTGLDPDRHRLVTRNVRVSRIADRRMGEWLDCGTTMNGERANIYDITFSMITHLAPVPEGGSRLNFDVNAVARSRTTSNSPANCDSTGNLEDLIWLSVVKKLEGEA